MADCLIAVNAIGSTYDLVELHGRRVLVFREWDDLRPLHDAVAKPLALARGASATSRGKFSSLRRADDARAVRRERDLAALVDPEGHYTDTITGHLRVAGLTVLRRWEPRPPHAAEQRVVDIAFAALFAAGLPADVRADAQPQVIGSRLYADPGVDGDIDLALELAPKGTVALREAAARLRRRVRQPADYPFRVPAGERYVDLLPARPAGQEHPLAGATRWVVAATGEIDIDAVVLDDALASYAWPVVMVDAAPGWVVICSNAFRGLPVAGQRLRGRAIEVDVERGSGTSATRVAVIGDPWRELQTPAFSA